MPIILVLKGSPAGYLLVVRFVWALCAAPFIIWVSVSGSVSLPLGPLLSLPRDAAVY